jgi:hypothetical protein
MAEGSVLREQLASERQWITRERTSLQVKMTAWEQKVKQESVRFTTHNTRVHVHGFYPRTRSPLCNTLGTHL